jgi:hypothetical protein
MIWFIWFYDFVYDLWCSASLGPTVTPSIHIIIGQSAPWEGFKYNRDWYSIRRKKKKNPNKTSFGTPRIVSWDPHWSQDTFLTEMHCELWCHSKDCIKKNPVMAMLPHYIMPEINVERVRHSRSSDWNDPHSVHDGIAGHKLGPTRMSFCGWFSGEKFRDHFEKGEWRNILLI